MYRNDLGSCLKNHLQGYICHVQTRPNVHLPNSVNARGHFRHLSVSANHTIRNFAHIQTQLLMVILASNAWSRSRVHAEGTGSRQVRRHLPVSLSHCIRMANVHAQIRIGAAWFTWVSARRPTTACAKSFISRRDLGGFWDTPHRCERL